MLRLQPTDTTVPTKHLRYSVPERIMNRNYGRLAARDGGSATPYQIADWKTIRERLGKYGTTAAGALGGTTAGLAYGLGTGTSIAGLLGAGVIGLGVGLLTGGIFGALAYWGWLKGKRKQEGRSLGKYVYDKLEALWEEGTKRQKG